MGILLPSKLGLENIPTASFAQSAEAAKYTDCISAEEVVFKSQTMLNVSVRQLRQFNKPQQIQTTADPNHH